MANKHIRPEKIIHSAGKVDVRNCRACDRVFDYPGYGPQVCPECLKTEEEQFEIVRSYLESHPRATLVQTTNDTGVSLRKLQAWLREERLSYATSKGSGFTCDLCGVPIVAGRLCPKCAGRLANPERSKRTLKGNSSREETE
ncbi:MAG: flagellar protein [Lachnospiraceae bacterium]|nr:flagellar protein [Lachnospiraceae bacterium]